MNLRSKYPDTHLVGDILEKFFGKANIREIMLSPLGYERGYLEKLVFGDIVVIIEQDSVVIISPKARETIKGNDIWTTDYIPLISKLILS